MKIDIVKEKENALLGRKEIRFEIDHPEESTPSKAAVQQLAAKQLEAEAGRVDVRHIFSGTGVSKSNASVFLWNEKRVEDLSKAKKPEEAGSAEQPEEAGTKPAEAPKENEAPDTKEKTQPEEKEPKKSNGPETRNEQETKKAEKPEDENK